MSKVYPSAEVIYKIEPHPNADRVEVAYIIGTTAVVPKGMYALQETVDFFPPDVTMSVETADKLGVTKYLKTDVRNNCKVVRATKIRGVVSYGIVVKSPCQRTIGEDLSVEYNTGKYEPSPDSKLIAGDGATSPAWFHEYTEIEHFYRNAELIEEGAQVWASEKIHGSNDRVGMYVDGTIHCGSHHGARKEVDVHERVSTYWKPVVALTSLLQELVNRYNLPVIVFSEIYGPGVQFMHYGLKESTFAAFDISVGGKYLDYEEFMVITSKHGVPIVQTLYVGPYI